MSVGAAAAAVAVARRCVGVFVTRLRDDDRRLSLSSPSPILRCSSSSSFANRVVCAARVEVRRVEFASPESEHRLCTIVAAAATDNNKQKTSLIICVHKMRIDESKRTLRWHRPGENIEADRDAQRASQAVRFGGKNAR